MSLLTVSHLYGHTSIATTARYLNASQTVVERETARFRRNQEPPHSQAPHDEDADDVVMQEPKGTLVIM